MSTQTTRKLLVVALLLLIFAVPFVVERQRLTSFNNNAFIAGGGAIFGQSLPSTPAAPLSQTTVPNVGLSVSGSDFIGNPSLPATTPSVTRLSNSLVL